MGWTGANKKLLAPDIIKLTSHFNFLSNWVAKKILEAEKIQTRLQILSFFINAAEQCFQLDNYDGVRSIMSGLQSAPIHRLHRTWAVKS